MGVKDYGFLIGTVADGKYISGNHYTIWVNAEKQYRVAVNIQSCDNSTDKSEVMMYISDDYKHEFLDRVHKQYQAKPGFYPVDSKLGAQSWGIDFLRRQMLDFNNMIPMPMRTPGPDNDLLEKVSYQTTRAQKQNGLVYLWGSKWQDPDGSCGVHDIHLNQGNPNPGRFAKDNGTWQDGFLVFYYPQESRYVAIFLAFQTQLQTAANGKKVLHTDDKTGHPIKMQPIAAAGIAPYAEEDVVISHLLLDAAESLPQKIALLNRTGHTISLSGWTLVNRQHQPMAIQQKKIAAYSIIEVSLPHNYFSQEGDMVVLLDNATMKIHGVSYTKAQVQPKKIIVF